MTPSPDCECADVVLAQNGAYSEWDAKRFAHDIFQALQFIHEHNIVHRYFSICCRSNC